MCPVRHSVTFQNISMSIYNTIFHLCIGCPHVLFCPRQSRFYNQCPGFCTDNVGTQICCFLYRTIWLLLDSIHRLVCGSFTKDHNVSETGSVSVLRWMGQGRPTQLGLSERATLNHSIESKRSQIVLNNIHHRQNPFKSICCFLFTRNLALRSIYVC
jgi:hypothetical protein